MRYTPYHNNNEKRRKRRKRKIQPILNPYTNLKSTYQTAIPSRSKVINRGYLSKNHPISPFLPSRARKLQLTHVHAAPTV